MSQFAAKITVASLLLGGVCAAADLALPQWLAWTLAGVGSVAGVASVWRQYPEDLQMRLFMSGNAVFVMALFYNLRLPTA